MDVSEERASQSRFEAICSNFRMKSVIVLSINLCPFLSTVSMVAASYYTVSESFTKFRKVRAVPNRRVIYGLDSVALRGHLQFSPCIQLACRQMIDQYRAGCKRMIVVVL